MKRYNDKAPTTDEIINLFKICFENIKLMFKTSLNDNEKKKMQQNHKKMQSQKTMYQMSLERVNRKINKYLEEYENKSLEELKVIYMNIKSNPKAISGNEYTDELAQLKAIEKILKNK